MGRNRGMSWFLKPKQADGHHKCPVMPSVTGFYHSKSCAHYVEVNHKQHVGILWPYFTLRNNPRCSFTWPVFHRPLWQQMIRQNPDAPDWVCRISKLNTKQTCHMVRNQIPFLQHETIFCLCRLSMHQRSLVPASCSWALILPFHVWHLAKNPDQNCSTGWQYR